MFVLHTQNSENENTVNFKWARGMILILILAVVAFMPRVAAGEKVLKPTAVAPLPPIPIHFTLKEDGVVTLVIEDAKGKRVRNLVSETAFPAGANTAWWDGLDDIGRIKIDANQYAMSPKLVAAGTYRVRGLVRKNLDLRYEFTAASHGNPPWATADKASEWLANHTPPSAVLFLPAGSAPERKGKPVSAGGQIVVGSHVSEGGSGVAWLDLKGNKLHGQMWIGGVWTGATQLARDGGDKPLAGVYAYTGSVWDDELRLHQLLLTPDTKQPLYGGQGGRGDTRFGYGEDRPVLSPNWKFPDKNMAALGGLAVHNTLIVAALTKLNQLLLIDEQKVLGTVALDNPHGLVFDSQGRLLAISGKRIVRYKLGEEVLEKPPAPDVLAENNLEDPQQIALDAKDNIYVTDRGESQQIKVFSPEGKFIRAIGHAGKPVPGPYDPAHMNNPNGITIDSNDRIWVAETDVAPKRISVWTLDGALADAFYGPPQYGGGGELDPADKSLFYYGGEGGGITFKLDWEKGTSEPLEVYYRADHNPAQLPQGWFVNLPPQTALYHDGHKFMTSVYNSNPTNGASIGLLYRMEKGVAVPCAAIGYANSWPLLAGAYANLPAAPPESAAFKTQIPKDIKPGDHVFFSWSDINGDGLVQPEEVEFKKIDASPGAITMMPDFSFVAARVNNKAMRYAPQGFTPSGIPQYKLDKGEVLVEGANAPTTSGGDQALVGADGWTILTVPPKPFEPAGMCGVKDGVPQWTYPSLWPGLHASHYAPMPQSAGQLIGTTRLLGGFVTPKGGDGGPLWAVNGNKGNLYLFTADGLFVATLFKDCRTASFNAPEATRGISVAALSLGEECFWPSISQTPDGNIYLTVLVSCIVRVDGLESIQRLPASTIEINDESLKAAHDYFVKMETLRQQAQKPGNLAVKLCPAPPAVDGKLDEWDAKSFVQIDTRAQGALAIAGDRLYAAFKTHDGASLNNSGEALQNIFKTGGALDLMLGAIPGGERLLVTRVNNKTVAILYRRTVPGTTGTPVKFVSNIGLNKTVQFDRVDDVSDQVQLAGGPDGNFEFSVPLGLLGLNPEAGKSMKGDIGLLRGNGFQTLQRVYWWNKATGLVADIASEAELTPQLWGSWEFKKTGDEK